MNEETAIVVSTQILELMDHEQAIHRAQAHANVLHWGPQNVETLALAISEQSGKLSQAFLRSEFEPEKYTTGQIIDQARHTAALCLQVAVALEGQDK